MEHWWWRRLRWRLRGAWQWPIFLLGTVADAVLLARLPVDGEHGMEPVAGFLLAGSVNLIALAALAPLAGFLLRRARPDLPRLVARDYGGTALVVAVTGAFLLAGLAHRDAVRDAREDRRAARAAAERWMLFNARGEHRAFAALVDLLKLEDDRYRACVPDADGDRWLCAFVTTTTRPPRVRPDTNAVSNARFAPR